MHEADASPSPANSLPHRLRCWTSMNVRVKLGSISTALMTCKPSTRSSPMSTLASPASWRDSKVRKSRTACPACDLPTSAEQWTTSISSGSRLSKNVRSRARGPVATRLPNPQSQMVGSLNVMGGMANLELRSKAWAFASRAAVTPAKKLKRKVVLTMLLSSPFWACALGSAPPVVCRWMLMSKVGGVSFSPSCRATCPMPCVAKTCITKLPSDWPSHSSWAKEVRGR
mmetsp:Transcript_53230/g.139626  ORF Transcript_53230/g.139626 Transcript_53230/m.139626 type:complete len:228 (-) Transcript_53230:1745-2428(-)